MDADLELLKNRPFELLRAIEARLRGREAAVAGVQSWTGLRFSISGQDLLVPRSEVREILPPPGYTRIPNAKPWLLGLANVRGNLLPIVDMRCLLLDEPVTIDAETRLLVMESEDTPAGFIVDRVAGFIDFEPHEQRHDKLNSLQDTVYAEYLLGAFVRDGETLGVFSLAKMASGMEFQQAAA